MLTAVSLAGRDLLRISDLAQAEAEAILDLAVELRASPKQPLLPGATLGLYFAKHSTRTRISFTAGMTQLGGAAMSLAPEELQLSRGESLPDTARALSRYLDALAVRTHEHAELEAWAEWASIPVINALTAEEHPCQALADLLTLRQHLGSSRGRRLAFVGDGNNVVHSLLLAGALAGLEVRVATPWRYAPDPQIVGRARQIAAGTGGAVAIGTDPAEAVTGADAVYTDVWTSMGAEAEAAERMAAFGPYQVNAELVAHAPDALVMHCLPAHRGQEITDEVLDGPRSVVLDQAENRLYAQQAVLLELLAAG